MVYCLISGINCNIGFYGFKPDCKKCPFPTYGHKCQSICACSNETCNHVIGCSASMPNTGNVSIFPHNVSILFLLRANYN